MGMEIKFNAGLSCRSSDDSHFIVASEGVDLVDYKIVTGEMTALYIMYVVVFKKVETIIKVRDIRLKNIC